MYGVADNEGQDLRENVDLRIQVSAETLDHQHAEDHVAEGRVLLDSMTDHRGKQFRHNGTHTHLRVFIKIVCNNYLFSK